MKSKIKTLISTNSNVSLIVISYMAIILITSIFHFRIDLTEGNLYTLSEGSKKIISTLDEDVTIKFFFSKSNRTLPLQVKNYGARVEELLEEFSAQSHHLKLEVFDPTPDSDEEEMAARYGINGVQVNDGESFYMGAALLYLDQVYQVPFFDPRREKFLEYEIASLLAKVGEKSEKTIGIISGFEMEDGALPFYNRGTQFGEEDKWLFRNELKELYRVQPLAKGVNEIPDNVDILLVAHPTDLDENTEYAIEQFILAGGKTVILVDPSPYTVEGSSSSNLPKVFKTLGIDYNPNEVVVDASNATMVSTPRGRLRLPVWLSFNDSGFSPSSVATSELKSGLFVESGQIKKSNSSDYKFEPLVTTSQSAGTVSSNMARSLAERPDDYTKKSEELTIAGIVKGQFKSSFPEKPKDSKFSRDHISQAKDETSVIVIGDVDFLNNQFALNALNFFGRTIVQPKNHNVAFLVNSIEYIAGRPELISVRSRGTFSRPFTTVQKLEQEAQTKWLGVEQDLSKKIQSLQTKLNELQRSKTSDNQVILSQQQKEEIKKFKLEQISAKKKRREVRKQLRQEIESLGILLSGINMGAIPALILGFGLHIYSRRNKGLPIFKKGVDNEK